MSAAEQLETPDPESFEVRRLADADGVVLVLSGELDLASAPALEQQLEEVAQAIRLACSWIFATCGSWTAPGSP